VHCTPEEGGSIGGRFLSGKGRTGSSSRRHRGPNPLCAVLVKDVRPMESGDLCKTGKGVLFVVNQESSGALFVRVLLPGEAKGRSRTETKGIAPSPRTSLTPYGGGRTPLVDGTLLLQTVFPRESFLRTSVSQISVIQWEKGGSAPLSRKGAFLEAGGSGGRASRAPSFLFAR